MSHRPKALRCWHKTPMQTQVLDFNNRVTVCAQAGMNNDSGDPGDGNCDPQKEPIWLTSTQPRGRRRDGTLQSSHGAAALAADRPRSRS